MSDNTLFSEWIKELDDEDQHLKNGTSGQLFEYDPRLYNVESISTKLKELSEYMVPRIDYIDTAEQKLTFVHRQIDEPFKEEQISVSLLPINIPLLFIEISNIPNLCIAGGSIVNLLRTNYEIAGIDDPQNEEDDVDEINNLKLLTKSNDVDIFFIGNNVEHARVALNEIKNLLIRMKYNIHMMEDRTHCIDIIVSHGPSRKIHLQIIKSLNSSLYHLLSKFDLDCCCIALKDGKLLHNRRFHLSWSSSTNLVSGRRNGNSYNYRLIKYLLRGFIPCHLMGVETEKKWITMIYNWQSNYNTRLEWMESNSQNILGLYCMCYEIISEYNMMVGNHSSLDYYGYLSMEEQDEITSQMINYKHRDWSLLFQHNIIFRRSNVKYFVSVQ